MKISEIKKQLIEESRSFIPNNKDQIFEALSIRTIHKQENKTSFLRSFKPALLLSFSLIVLIVVAISLLQKGVFSPVYVTIDINPSIEIELNEENKVTNIRPLNTDGVLLLDDHDFINQDVTEVIDTIITLATNSGYLNDENKVNINSLCDDSNTEANLNNFFKTYYQDNQKINVKEITGSVKNQAKIYDISPHKMEIIYKIISDKSDLKIEDLKEKSIQELNQIVRDYSEDKMKEFINNYGKSKNGLSQAKREGIDKLIIDYNRYYAFIQEIKNQITSQVSYQEIQNKIIEYFPEYINYNFENMNYDDYNDLVNDVLEAIETKHEMVESLIEDKYNSQIEAYKERIRENNHVNPDEFEFDFDFDYSLDNYQENENESSKESEAIILVDQITALIRWAPQNQQVRERYNQKVKNLMNQLEEILESDYVTEEFKNSDKIKTFLETYQNYIKN